MLVIISFSGCTGTSYKTYSNEYLSFQYPDGWQAQADDVGGVVVRNGSEYDVGTTQQFYVIPFGSNMGNVASLDVYYSGLADEVSGTDPSMVKKGNVNGTSYTLIDNSSTGQQSWKSIYFIKNGKAIVVTGNVNDVAVLEHVVATF